MHTADQPTEPSDEVAELPEPASEECSEAPLAVRDLSFFLS